MSIAEHGSSPATVMISLRAFGPLTEKMPQDATIALPLPLPVAAIRERLVSAYPLLREQPFRIAVDARLPGEDVVITEAEEIALLPPFAGG